MYCNEVHLFKEAPPRLCSISICYAPSHDMMHESSSSQIEHRIVNNKHRWWKRALRVWMRQSISLQCLLPSPSPITITITIATVIISLSARKENWVFILRHQTKDTQHTDQSIFSLFIRNRSNSIGWWNRMNTEHGDGIYEDEEIEIGNFTAQNRN